MSITHPFPIANLTICSGLLRIQLEFSADFIIHQVRPSNIFKKCMIILEFKFMVSFMEEQQLQLDVRTGSD